MQSKSKVFFMCGPAGSGKSHLAKKFESVSMIKLNFDDESFKRGITQHPLPESIEYEIKNFLDKKLIKLLEEGKDVILDYSFWSKSIRKEYIDLVGKYNVKPLIFYIKTPKKIALERVAKRKGIHSNDIFLSSELAEKYYDNFQAPTLEEGIIIIVHGLE